MQESIFRLILTIWFLIAFFVFILLLVIPVPYGRYSRKGWGPSISSRLAWLIMESVAVLAFAIWTFANPLPRARWHHRWYRNHFKGYPEQRKMLIPYLM